MKVKVLFFALAKDRAGTSELEIELPNMATICDLRVAITKRFSGLAELLPQVRWAVNAVYAGDSTALKDQDEIALIPPVSGG